MTEKSKKIVLASVISAVVVAVVAVCATLLILFLPDKIAHVQTQGVELSLVRNKLTYNQINENGYLLPTTDKTEKDFTKPTTENIFGIDKTASVIPGSMYEVEMTVAAENGQPFCYWLEVKTDGSDSKLYQLIKLTVTTQDGTKKKFNLSDGFLIGSETQPIDTVQQGTPSVFRVKMELSDSVSDNSVQGQLVSFDLVVHAVALY